MNGNSLTSLLLIAGICIGIGCAFGWLVASMRGGAKPEEPVLPSVVLSPESLPPPQPALLRLVRDVDRGSLNLEFAGKMAQTVDQLSAEECKQVVDLLKETSGWLGLLAPANVVTQPVPNALQRQLVVPGPEVGIPVVAAAAEPIKPSVLGGVTNAIANSLGAPPAKKDAPKTMVQQIDDILQTGLAGTALKNQKIFLVEDPRKGVLVNVGLNTYEGIGAVPEGEVKNILKNSVQEWERQQEELRRRNRA